MISMKFIADILTTSRLVITIILIWIGWTRGAECLYLASICLLVSWTSDVLDGSLARLNKTHKSTWIGNHDLYFDMAVSIGLLIYLTESNFITPSISIIYLFGWIFIFWRFGILSALGKLFQAPIYAWFIVITFQNQPLFGWLLVILLLLVVIFTWPRFPQDTVPDFIKGFGNKQTNIK